MQQQSRVPHRPFAGLVYLVGAGAGNPDFLTLGAVKALQVATFVLVDSLVNPAVLEHVSGEATIRNVGKRGSCKSTSQQSIETLMLQAALEGHTVVRLKGGDPLIFGRGGEELAFLHEHGIVVHIVPGVSASVAAARDLGIALTHRAYAQGFLCMTGHSQPKQEDAQTIQARWVRVGASVHDLQLTLCVYMGLRQLSVIQAGLLHSLPEKTLAALVVNASVPEQHVCVTTLADLLRASTQTQIQSPVMLLVGGSLEKLARTNYGLF